MQVRITGVPPGEAPEWVRRAWVGLVLPLASGENGPRTRRGAGVLTGPRGCATALVHLLLGRTTLWTGYVIDADVAVWLLAERSPEAAAWWRENAPHALQPGRRFIFPQEVCEEEWRAPPGRPGGRRPPGGDARREGPGAAEDGITEGEDDGPGFRR
jgi:hypothetical protein